MKKEDEQHIVEFCNSVKKGFGSIVDCVVKKEYERIYESSIQPESLADLLALLETHNLLDKKYSINNDKSFYRDMRKKMKANA